MRYLTMDKLLKVYEEAKELMKHKEELHKYPDLFSFLLTDLRKAIDDDKDSKKSRMAAWKQREDMSPKEQAALKELTNQGYSPREAERMLPGYRGKGYVNHGVEPSMMSTKMMGDMKPLAKLWMEGADRRDKMKADPESNTVKRQAGKLMEAHEKHTGDFTKDYSSYLKSPELKEMSPGDRHKNITAWKADWKDKNPQYEQGLPEISQAQRDFAYKQNEAKQTAKERHEDIVGGKMSGGDTMSAQEAMQHMGGGKTDEGYQGGHIETDPTIKFAQNNPQLKPAKTPEEQASHQAALDSMDPDMLDRNKNIDSHRAIQKKPPIVIRRKGN